jgi:hypothetical protein
MNRHLGQTGGTKIERIDDFSSGILLLEAGQSSNK